MFIWVVLEGDCFIDQVLHHKDIKPILLSDLLSLCFLASEGVTSQTHFQSEVVGCGWVFEIGSWRVVKLDQLVNHVTEDMVVLSRVR